MPSGYRVIARVVKTHANKGEVVAVAADGLPLLLRPGLRVCVVPPALKGPRWHDIVSVDTRPAGQLVGLSDVRDKQAAEGLVGRFLLVSVADLPDDLSMHDASALVGREVVDNELGALGRIVEVMLGPANDVWVLDGPYGEVLLPVVEQVVVEVPDEGPILVDAPTGSVEG